MDKAKFNELKTEFKHMTKEQILAAIEELRNLDRVQKEINLEDILMSGQLDANTFLFRDEEEGFNIVRGGKIDKWDNATVKSHIMQKFMITNGTYVSNRMNFIPIYRKIFNPKNTDRIYSENQINYFNAFFPTTYIEKADSIKAKDRYSLDIEYIKENYKYVYLLLWNLFREEKHIKFFINWFAAALNEREKLGVSIALKGVQGAGKNLLYDNIIKKAVGFDFAPTLDNERLKSKFNRFLTESLFVCWNEIKGDFKDNSLLADKMKSLITEPNIIIERKGIDADTRIITYFNSFIFSNHSLPFQIDPDDRRFFVLETRRENFKNVVKRVLDIPMEEYVNKLNEEADSFLNYIVAIDYDLELAKQVPMTVEKMSIAEATTPQISLFGNKLKTRTVESITYLYEVFIDMFEEGEDLSWDLFKQNLKKFLQEVADGKVSIHSLKFAYRFFVNSQATKSKIEKDLKAEFGETKRNSKMRYKFLGKPVDIDIEALFAGTLNNTVNTVETKETMEIMNEVIEDIHSSKANENSDSIFTPEFESILNEPLKKKNSKEDIINTIVPEQDFDKLVEAVYS